jgi:hypothetical protein
MKNLFAILLIFITVSCAQEEKVTTPGDSSFDSVDVLIQEDGEELKDSYSIWMDPCVECAFYFCPPLDAVWQKQMCFDFCLDPPVLVLEGECVEYLECNPSQYLIENDLPCLDDQGLPGKQDKICIKGQVQFTDCETDCVEETCDGLDNDCDDIVDEGFEYIAEECNNIDDNCNGIIDEGDWVCDYGCGPAPNLCVAGELVCTAAQPEEEICDGVDNDCDGEVDEGQLNACDMCGAVPQEECNGVDDDCNGLVDDGLISPCSTACGSGYETCVDGNWVSCNAPAVYDEICDGLDNDCDGMIDEDLECICTIQDVGTLFACQESPVECGQGFKTCLCEDPSCEKIVTSPCYPLCYWATVPPGEDPSCDITAGMPVPEMCNNFDDNCNQLIDENLFSVCYTGPEDTVGVGICKPGEAMCDAGEWGNINEDTGLFTPGYCKDEITPQAEICDGVDNDCDGVTDYGKELKETDVLFIVDWSGSMVDEKNAVLIALNQFAATYSDEEVIQWGTILGPRNNPLTPWSDDILELYQNLSPFSDFLAAMASLAQSPMAGGKEMLLDALYLSIQKIATLMPRPIIDFDWSQWGVGESIPHHDQFLIDWRPDSEKIMIVFTDEKPQSFLVDNSFIKLFPDEVITAVKSTPKLKVYVFSTSTLWEWDELADATGGKYYPLSSNPTDMYVSLMEILDDICK